MTEAADNNHKYSLFPLKIFASCGVLVSFIEFMFSKKKRSLKNYTKTPGIGKSLLSPREYSWRLVTFVETWERAREKV